MSLYKQKGSVDGDLFGILFICIVIFVIWFVFHTPDPELEDVLSPAEYSMLEAYGDYTNHSHAFFDQEDAYVATNRALYLARISTDDNKLHRVRDKNAPFCDVIDEILLDESNLSEEYKNEFLITAQYKRVSGTDLYFACKYLSALPELPIKVETPVAVEETEPEVVVEEKVEIVTVDESEVLSPELYRQVTKAIKTCKRAADDVRILTADGRYLTKSDYPNIMKSVMQCEQFTLEKELNEIK